MYHTYILLCDDRYYIGQTDNIEQRLAQHQQGLSPHTKRYSVIKLVYTETFIYRKDAELRELQLKKWSRAKKHALINGQFAQLTELSKSKS